MRWQSLASRTVANAVGLARAPIGPRKGLRILMYHSIGSVAHNDRLGIFSVSPNRFRHHVEVFAEQAEFQVVPLDPLYFVEDELRVVVTFDDGYLDNLYVAAPLLIEHGIPFVVFVTANFVRERVRGFLDPPALRELASLPGVIIGAHGETHRPLLECNEEALAGELQGSKRYLEDVIGRQVDAVSYPHGAADARVCAAARSAGYNLGLCSRFDINRRGSDPLMLSRCTILSDDGQRIIRQKLRGDWDWYRWR